MLYSKDRQIGNFEPKQSKAILNKIMNNEPQTITFDDFEKVDIRVGKIIEISDFPEARKPAYKLKIDFGSEIGIKQSSVQAVEAHAKEELLNSLVCCVVNFPSKQVGPFKSEVLTLGFKNNSGDGWVLIEPKSDSVTLGSKLS